MYDNERSSGLNIRSIIGKIIFLAAFALLLIWLLPKVPNMKPFYSNVFRENLSYMKDTAKGYYTNERLPQNIGEETKLTLQQLIDQNMIVPFVDKDGNSCDTYESYVSVIKNTSDYTLKINLVCDAEEKFIVETLGCYDKCGAGSCIKEEMTLEYQFKKVSKKNVSSCTCPDGYVDRSGVCYKSITSSKIAAEPVKESNYNYTYDAKVIEGKTSIVCADSTYTYNTTTGKCTKTVPADYTPGTNYSYEYNVQVPALTKVIESGSTCITKRIVDGTTDSCIWLSSGDETISCGTNCTKQAWVSYYKCCTKKTTTVEYCDDGSNPSGGMCTVTKTGYRTTQGGYYCKIGDLDSSKTKCILTGTTTTVKEQNTYECEKTSDIPVGSKCYRTIEGQFKYYECPKNQGYTIDGAWCYKTTEDTKNKSCTSSTKTFNSYKWSTSKTLSGWTLTGKTREVKNKI
jgi:hypothetical protein